ncbi:hypothetical protein ACA910_010925 [Epithemia clementina (nom. ined.)]
MIRLGRRVIRRGCVVVGAGASVGIGNPTNGWQQLYRPTWWSPFFGTATRTTRKWVASSFSSSSLPSTTTTTTTTNTTNTTPPLRSTHYINRWKQFQTRFLSAPVGSLVQHDGRQAVELLAVLRTHSTFQSPSHSVGQQQQQQQERIQSMFLVLDRCCQELEYYHSQAHAEAGGGGGDNVPLPNSHGAGGGQQAQPPKPTVSLNTDVSSLSFPSLFPLDGGILGATLVAWRDFVLQRHNDPWLLDPMVIWQRIERYRQAHMFVVLPAAYAIVLHVMSKTLQKLNQQQGRRRPQQQQLLHNKNDKIYNFKTFAPQPQQPQQRLLLRAAQTIHQSLLERAQYNPYDVWQFPTSATVYGLVLVWAQYADYDARAVDEATVEVESLLQSLRQWYQQTKRLDQQPTANLYCVAMQITSHHHHGPAALKRILQWYHEMQQTCHDWETGLVNARVCHALANVSSTSSYSYSFATRRSTPPPHHHHHPHLHTTNHPGTPEATAADWARMLFLEQNERYRKHNRNPLYQPDTYALSAVLTALGRAGRANDATQLFDQVLDRTTWTDCSMANNNNNNNPTQQQPPQKSAPTISMKPNMACYAAMIWVYAQVGDFQRAEGMFHDMMKAMEQGSFGDKKEERDVALDFRMWDGILAAWAGSGDPRAPAYITQVIQRLRDLLSRRFSSDDNDNNNGQGSGNIQQQQQHQNVTIPVTMYNKLLGCYADQSMAQQAEELFRWMEQESQQHPELTPNDESYLSLILAFSKARNPERCEFYLRQYCNALFTATSPSIICSTTHNHDTQQQQRKQSAHHPQRGNDDGASALGLRGSQKPFGVAIAAWANSEHPEKAWNAQAIFDLMQQELQQPPDPALYSSLMWAWARSDPDIVGDPAPPVERLLQEMKQRYTTLSRRRGHTVAAAAAKPTDMVFNAFFAALSKSPNPTALERAERVFREMSTVYLVEPNVHHYTTLMTGWSKKNRNQPERAEQLFQEFKQKNLIRPINWHSSTNIERKSDAAASITIDCSAIYRSRLEAWSQAGDPEMTSRVLKEWIDDSKMLMLSSSSSSLEQRCSWFLVRPGVRDKGAILRAWLRSSHPKAADMAAVALRQMVEKANPSQNQQEQQQQEQDILLLDFYPNSFYYDTVISAFSKSVAPDAGEKALGLFKELQGLVASTPANPNSNNDKEQEAPSFMEPTLVSYSGVIVALCHSLLSFSRLGDVWKGEITAKTESVCSELEQLLGELQTKPARFWSSVRTPERLLGMVKQAIYSIGSSSLLLSTARHQSLLAQCSKLETVMLSHKNTSTKGGNRQISGSV